MKANQKIRQKALARGVKLWEIAMATGVSESTLNRKLRVELTETEQEKINGIINSIADSRKEVI